MLFFNPLIKKFNVQFYDKFLLTFFLIIFINQMIR
jgi:hypothetical protein